MKPEELFIGAIVSFENRPCMVEHIERGIVCIKDIQTKTSHWITLTTDDIRPVPITPEILKKNGFKKCNEDADGAIQYEFGSKNLGVDIWTPGSKTKSYLLGAWNKWPDCTESYNMINEMPIHYVHELQLALRLCKIVKEIKV